MCHMADIINFKTRKKVFSIRQFLKNAFLKFKNFKYKHMVAYGRRSIQWVDDDNKVEDMDFYLYETIFGKRTWEVYSYGNCKICREYSRYLGDINIWIHGGPLPNWVHKTEQQTILPTSNPYKDNDAPKPAKPRKNNDKPDFKLLKFPKDDDKH
jgi:hypothetical protein